MAGHQRDETAEDRLVRESKQREHERDYTDPVKHFVRKQVWVPVGQARLQTLRHERRGESLKYFTLCAKKAIDVHLFGMENLVEFDGRGYPGVVFCECFPDQYSLITASLRRTRGFLAYFEDLVLERESPESQDFYSELPFDVYNLDFTGVCFPKAEPPFSKTLDAIVALIEVLASPPYREGFDIFLTFRAKRSEENEKAISQLKGNVRENRTQHDWYNDAFVQMHGDNIGPLLQTYHEFLLRTLPKLLGKFAKEAGFRVACPHSLCYPRPDAQHPQYYIISFVLSFDWVEADVAVRRSIRQPVSRDEVVTDAYFSMMRQVIGQQIKNVGAVRFARDRYAQEVQELLRLVEDF